MMARRQSYLDALAATLPDTSVGIAIDLTDQAQVQHAFADIHARFGAVDVLIYNAARGTFGGFLDVDPAELEKNFSVNTMGLLYCARAAAPKMIERGRGSIIKIVTAD
jgi:short-subunit dehydrogenase